MKAATDSSHDSKQEVTGILFLVPTKHLRFYNTILCFMIVVALWLLVSLEQRIRHATHLQLTPSHRSIPPRLTNHPSGRTTIVALITEGKGGSTAIGELFNQHNDVFFLFEPLYSRRLQKTPIQTLRKSLLACLFNSAEFTRDVFWGYGTVKNRWFRKTFKQRSRELSFNETQRSVIEGTCLKAKIRAAKFIRVMDFQIVMDALMRNVPLCETSTQTGCVEVKIVHVVRDPRSIMASRIQSGWVSTDEEAFRTHTASLCTAMDRKYHTAFNLPPTTLMRVYFEKWVRNTTFEMSRLLDFLRLKPEKYLLERMQKVTEVDLHRHGQKLNVSKVFNRWRSVLTPNHLSIIHEQCDHVRREYGYTD